MALSPEFIQQMRQWSVEAQNQAGAICVISSAARNFCNALVGTGTIPISAANAAFECVKSTSSPVDMITHLVRTLIVESSPYTASYALYLFGQQDAEHKNLVLGVLGRLTHTEKKLIDQNSPWNQLGTSVGGVIGITPPITVGPGLPVSPTPTPFPQRQMRPSQPLISPSTKKP